MGPCEVPSSVSEGTALGPGAGEPEKVRLRVSFRGRFACQGGAWKYVGGESILESMPLDFKYSDLVFRLTEKVESAIALKYQLPGECLDPDALISVTGDDDLQEMVEEYFRALRSPGTPVKTFRLRVFCLPAEEEPLTPADILDGAFMAGRSRSGSRMQAEGKSSFGSNASSGSGLNSVDTDAMELWAEGFLAGQNSAKSHEAFTMDRDGSTTPPQQRAGLKDAVIDGYNPPDTEMKSPYDTGLPKRGAVACGAAAVVGAPSVRPIRFGDAAKMLQTQDHWYTEPDVVEEGSGSTMPSTAHPSSKALPSRIAVFGDEGVSGVRLPSHISAFGDDADDVAALDVDAPMVPSGGGGAAAGGAGLFSAAGDMPQLPQPTEHLTGGAAPAPNAGWPRKPPATLPGEASALALQFPGVHRVPREGVRTLRTIGEGAFGEVSEAETVTFGRVAVKWLKATKMERHSQNFWREAELLSALNHPNVLRFYGVVVEEPDNPMVVGIMTEFMRSGSLSALLRASRQYLTLRQRSDLALQAACGMAYLHEMAIVHFDLKPDNLLVDGELLGGGGTPCVVKVADFGLSKQRTLTHVSGLSDLRGTLPYMAPELVCSIQNVTEAADVWSFGVCMWEMLTLEVPHADLKPEQILAGLMTGSLQLEVPEWCEPEWRGLMEACWEVNPSARPTFRELVPQLQKVRDSCA